MKKILIILILLRTFTANAVDYKFNVIAYPDSCQIYMNGETMGSSPLVFKYPLDFLNTPEYSCTLVVAKAGYISDTIRFTKKDRPEFPKATIKVVLNRQPNSSAMKMEPLISMDKVLLDLPEGTNIGTVKNGMPRSKEKDATLTWNAEYTIEAEDFNKLAIEELNRAGFNMKKQARLFDGEVVEKDAPLLLGASLKSLKYDYTYGIQKVEKQSGLVNTFTGPVNVTCTIELEWQLFSRKKRSVIYSSSIQGVSFSFVSNDIKGDLRNAVRDALISLSYDEKFREAVTLYNEPPSSSSKDLKQITFKKVATENFATYADMLKKRSQSTVTIVREDESHGSGFIISSDGYIITNFHVIDKSKNLTIKFENGFEFPAEVISFDEEYDVALLKIKGNGFKGIPVNTSMAGVGTDVTAIGTPAKIELGQTVTKGIISGKREIEGKIFYQTDVSVSPGNSGGPLINANGEVLGIITWGLRGDGIEGLNFAIPISVALEKLGITFTP